MILECSPRPVLSLSKGSMKQSGYLSAVGTGRQLVCVLIYQGQVISQSKKDEKREFDSLMFRVLGLESVFIEQQKM